MLYDSRQAYEKERKHFRYFQKLEDNVNNAKHILQRSEAAEAKIIERQQSEETKIPQDDADKQIAQLKKDQKKAQIDVTRFTLVLDQQILADAEKKKQEARKAPKKGARKGKDQDAGESETTLATITGLGDRVRLASEEVFAAPLPYCG